MQTSQDSLSSLSQFSASPYNGHSETAPSKLTNGLQLLRSPGPEDFKKKKGWSSSSKGRKSVSASQESSTQLSSTPAKAEIEVQTPESLPKCKPSPSSDELISYSPLSEMPAESEVRNNECKKALFNGDASESDAEGSMELFSDGFSSEDELLTEFIDNMEADNVQTKEHASLAIQLESVTSAPSTNQEAASSVAENQSSGKSSSSLAPRASSIQSPQSLVLERLRETLRNSDSLPLRSLNDSSVKSGLPHAASPQVPSAQTMPLQGKTAQVSCLKQTDIGVFFGLKPLKEKEQKTNGGPNEQTTTSASILGENSRRQRQLRKERQPRKERQRSRKAEASADASQELGENSNITEAQRGAGKGGSRGWRGRRRNRMNADGEVELPRCPFYKKIPGQKTAFDYYVLLPKFIFWLLILKKKPN